MNVKVLTVTLSAALISIMATSMVMAAGCNKGWYSGQAYNYPPSERAYRPMPQANYRYAPPGIRAFNLPHPSYGFKRQPAAIGPAKGAATINEAGTNSTNTVSISQMRFEPQEITIKKGDSVTWKQMDNMPHTVTATNSEFSSPQLITNSNSTFTQTFNQSGKFEYFCSIHPGMKGVVVVQ